MSIELRAVSLFTLSLMNKVQNAQVSDTTADATRTTAKYIKIVKGDS